MYYDGQFNDARLNVALACSTAAAGGAVLNYVECKQLIKVGQVRRSHGLKQGLLLGLGG